MTIGANTAERTAEYGIAAMCTVSRVVTVGRGTILKRQGTLRLGESRPVPQGEAGERTHAKAFVERDEIGVAYDVDHVEAFQLGQQPMHQFGSNSMATPFSADLKERDVCRQNTVADGRHESDELVTGLSERHV